MSLHPVFATILAAHGMPQRNGWDTVQQVFDNRLACEGCPRYEIEHDSVPYGEGWVRKSHERCSLGEYASDRAEDCPGFEAKGEDE